MTQAVIYTRVSSREQQQEGFSLDAQGKLLREYADRNGIESSSRLRTLRRPKQPVASSLMR
jgi:site-specific DNA recombinase